MSHSYPSWNREMFPIPNFCEDYIWKRGMSEHLQPEEGDTKILFVLLKTTCKKGSPPPKDLAEGETSLVF